jgi:hypothetical protein
MHVPLVLYSLLGKKKPLKRATAAYGGRRDRGYKTTHPCHVRISSEREGEDDLHGIHESC